MNLGGIVSLLKNVESVNGSLPDSNLKFSFPRSCLLKPVLSASKTRKCAAAKFGRSVGCSFRTARASDSRAAGKPGGTVNCPEVRTEDMSKLSKVSLISFQGKR